jgi:hypothetical protein
MKIKIYLDRDRYRYRDRDRDSNGNRLLPMETNAPLIFLLNIKH